MITQQPIVIRIAALGLITINSLIALSGCIDSSGGNSDNGGGEKNDPTLPSPEEIETKVIDVSDSAKTAYLNITEGKIEQSANDSKPDNWHISFAGKQIRTNTAQGVRGFLGADAPEEFYDGDGNIDPQAVRDASPDDYRDRLIGSFEEIDASIKPAIAGDVPQDGSGDFFYRLDMSSMPPKLVENDDYGWLIRGRDGETYARMRATHFFFDMGGNEDIQYTFTMDLQPGDAGGFESHSNAADIEFSGELKRYRTDEKCFDFSEYDHQDKSPGEADCDSAEWDLKIFRDPTAAMGEDMTLLINGGFDRNGAPRPGDAAALGSLPWSDLADKHSAQDVLGYPDEFKQDSVQSIAADDWFVDIEGDNQHSRTIFPTYRVYVIDTDAAADDAPRYAFQIIDYYDEEDNPGHITARYVELP
ncbi:hypothetical protein LRD18_03205 [Halorhodospira halochloris]|uniref:hypothetical protein n=1 Tax=Halorhodospira halochloris TaxID=1052 RepID=UPI001EE8D19E|nr:hypothetical protein [Halorhodospira halochloris]MCG5529883.1 hypothetical protein [Halorhodospira halochloris]